MDRFASASASRSFTSTPDRTAATLDSGTLSSTTYSHFASRAPVPGSSSSATLGVSAASKLRVLAPLVPPLVPGWRRSALVRANTAARLEMAPSTDAASVSAGSGMVSLTTRLVFLDSFRTGAVETSELGRMSVVPSASHSRRVECHPMFFTTPRPNCFAATTSPTLNGCVTKSWSPPMRFPTNLCAAKPSATPPTPVNARRPVTSRRSAEAHITAAANQTTTLRPLSMSTARAWRSQLTPSSPRSAAKCAALQSSSAEEGWASSGDGDPTVGPLAERGGGSLAAQMYLASTTLSAARRKRKVNTWNQCRYPPVSAAPSAPIFWSAKRAVLDAHPEKVAEEEKAKESESAAKESESAASASATPIPKSCAATTLATPHARAHRSASPAWGPNFWSALVDHAGAPMRAARRETVLHSERDHRLMYLIANHATATTASSNRTNWEGVRESGAPNADVARSVAARPSSPAASRAPARRSAAAAAPATRSSRAPARRFVAAAAPATRSKVARKSDAQSAARFAALNARCGTAGGERIGAAPRSSCGRDLGAGGTAPDAVARGATGEGARRTTAFARRDGRATRTGTRRLGNGERVGGTSPDVVANTAALGARRARETASGRKTIRAGDARAIAGVHVAARARDRSQPNREAS